MAQSLITIECRFDFTDKTKKDQMVRIMREAAVHADASMALLADGQRPQVVFFCDDFFEGHQALSLHEDVLGKALTTHGDEVGEGGISDELLAAAKQV
jgi:hypothetical protein